MPKLTSLDQHVTNSIGIHDVSNKELYVKFTTGKYAGSFVKILNIKTGNVYRNKYNRSARHSFIAVIKSIKINWEPKPITIACVRHRPNSVFGSNLEIYEGSDITQQIIENELSIQDCFGTEFYIGAIVSYKRVSRQIFSTVVDISDNGRIKLQRFFGNENGQTHDYINFGNAHEYLILNEELMDNLTILKLKQ